MKKILSGALVGLLMVAAASSFAWGPREQGALAGFVAGTIIGPNIVVQPPIVLQPYPSYPAYTQRPIRAHQPQICGATVYCGPTYSQPGYYSQQPQCSYYPILDQYGRQIGRERLCN